LNDLQSRRTAKAEHIPQLRIVSSVSSIAWLLESEVSWRRGCPSTGHADPGKVRSVPWPLCALQLQSAHLHTFSQRAYNRDIGVA
jgi:hypothetical protein